MSHDTTAAPCRALQQLPAVSAWRHLEAALLAVLPHRLRFVWLSLTGAKYLSYPVRLVPLSEKPEGLAIRHGLGRAHRGWIVCHRDAPGQVLELAPERFPGLGHPDDPALFLASTAPVTIKLLVF